MSRGTIWLFAVVILSGSVAITLAQQSSQKLPRRIDEAALENAGNTGEEWISYNQNWSEQRYSPLKQI
ncbi:MAG TPA: hypothetical protein VHC72_02060, partial [Bryobacteraceae bacterium]|nr:hypothetical protein [Bryobacteraceae bacterium]